MSNFFEVKNVTFSSNRDHALDNVSFNISNKGEIISILGPSGVGKTTVLRAIAGLDKIKKGEIWLNGNLISSKDFHTVPENRNIALSFQDNSLFPHLKIIDNIKLGINRQTQGKKVSLEKCVEFFFFRTDS